MKTQVLFFFPHNPYPPRTGAHKRCLEMLGGLKELGCEVSLASSRLCSDTNWERSGIEALRERWVRNVELQGASEIECRMLNLLRKCYRQLFGTPLPGHPLYFSLGMHHWFVRIISKLSPDIIVMNYAYWDVLLDHHELKSVTRIMETHDLVTLNERMRKVANKYLARLWVSHDIVDEPLLRENFFENLGLTAKPEEFHIYDKYDYTIAISSKEADIIRQNTFKTQVVHIPMTQTPCYLSNLYSAGAVYTAGPNPFNSIGYFYFVKKVLPIVRTKLPSFDLQVAGSFFGTSPRPEAGISLIGFVSDLRTLYRSSRFFVCPVYGGTGQQVKIVEAMAHGLPVIALHSAAKRSPIQHEINGLVANNAEEFADNVIRLWNDRRLCQRLGEAARQTIAYEYSHERLLTGLSELIQSAGVES
jgi:glycosyltransferase involved in cell wall biosynthesis